MMTMKGIKKKISIALILVLLMSVIQGFPILQDKVKASVGTNIALPSYGTVVSTTHEDSWADPNGYGYERLTDETTTGKFFITLVDTEYQYENIHVSYQFNKAYVVDSVRLYAVSNGGFPEDFTIQAYTGTGWETVVTKAGYHAQTGWQEFSFEETECTAIRLNSTKNSLVDASSYGVYLGEFEVYGKEAEQKMNVALPSNGTVATTSHEDSWANPNGYGYDCLTDETTAGKFFITLVDAGYQYENIYVSYQFNKTYAVDSVRLYAVSNGGFPEDFTIQAYTRTGWKTVVTQTGYNAQTGWQEFSFEETECTAIRLNSTKNSLVDASSYGVYLGEFEVYGKEAEQKMNVALPSNGTVATTSHEDSWANQNGYGYDCLTDETTTDKFFITKASTEYQNTNIFVTYTFAETYTVDQMCLYAVPNGGFPQTFTLEAYTKNGWEVVASEEDYEAQQGWQEFNFPKVDCSAVRLNSTKNGVISDGTYGIYLGEFAVYGVESSETVPLPPNDDNDIIPEPVGYNVALASNGTIPSTTHTDSWGEENGYGKQVLNDGNPSGKFYITKTDAQYKQEEIHVALQFQTTYKVDKIRLYAVANGGFPTKFKLEAYTKDGWTTVVEKNNYIAQAGWQEFEFEAVDCSGVRLCASENGITEANLYGVYLGEFEAYGVESTTQVKQAPLESEKNPSNKQDGKEEDDSSFVNAALAANGTTVSLTHPDSWGEENGYGINKLNDGLLNRFFISAASVAYEKENIKISMRFNKTYEVNQVNLYSVPEQGGFPVDFTIEAYTKDGWKTIVRKTNYKVSGEKQEFSFEKVACSAVRLNVTRNGKIQDGNYGVYLKEFEVLGIESTKKVSAAPKETAVTSAVSANGGNSYNAETNLALNLPTTARTDYAQYNAGKEKATDGNLRTFWSCNLLETSKDQPEWLIVNLLDNYEIDEVVLYSRDYGWGFPQDIVIRVFYDDEWKTVVDVKNYTVSRENGTSEYVFRFPAVVGNQVKIEGSNFVITDTEEYGFQLAEIAVYGDKAIGDYVLPCTNIVSSSTGVTTGSELADYGFSSTFLIDGDDKTGYVSEQHADPHHEEWIELDLKRSLKMKELQLKPAWGGNGFPVDFRVEVLENDKWSTVLEVKDYEKPINEAWQKFQLDRLVEGSKVRIVVTKLGDDFGQYCLRLNEIAIYPTETEGEAEGAIEVLKSKPANYNFAEKIDTELQIPIGIIIGGAVLMLLAILGVAILYIKVNKK